MQASAGGEQPVDDDVTLAARQAVSQREFFRALASGSSGARLIELDGVQGTAVPARPWFSIFNSAFYDDSSALEAGLDELAGAYDETGVKAWSVWVPPGDDAAATLLERAGLVVEGGPLRMAAPLSAIDLPARAPIELEPAPSWEMVARCNDRAHGVLEEWTMAAAFDAMDDAAAHLHAVRIGGEVAAALIAREHEGDCYLWFVATVPEAQRQGLGAELLRHALREALSRGCQTTSLESTSAGERLYTKLGYRPLGRFRRYERRG